MQVELEYQAVDAVGDVIARGKTMQELEKDLLEALSYPRACPARPLTIKIDYRRWFGD